MMIGLANSRFVPERIWVGREPYSHSMVAGGLELMS